MLKPRPTLLFIPGLMSDETAWADVAEAFRADRAVTIGDVSPGNSITGMAENILANVEGPVIPIGHSMGGRIALEMERVAKDRVAGLVLTDTGVHPLKDGELENRQAMIDLGNNVGMGALANKWLPPMVAESRHKDVEFIQMLRDMIFRAGPATHERQILALIGRPDARPQLSTIECPVLLIAGDEDRWSPPSQHQDMTENLADAKLVVVEGAGHFAPTEKPDIVAGAIREWLVAKQL